MTAARSKRELLDGIRIEVRQTDCFSIFSPWLELEGTANPAVLASLSRTLRGDPATTQEDVERADVFLEAFRDYPIAYARARENFYSISSQPSLPERSVWRSPESLLGAALQLQGEFNAVSCLPTQWDWDVGKLIASSSNSTGAVDPVTLQGLLAHRRVQHEVVTGRKRRVLNWLKAAPPGEFVNVARRIIRQALEVTLAADTILAEAVRANPAQAVLIERLRGEERGHDAFMRKALNSLPPSADDKPGPYIGCEIAVFRMAASTSLAAFAGLLASFEGAPSSDDPLAALLDERGFERAAKALRAHWAANHEHGHEGVAEVLCEATGEIDHDEAEYAARMVELSAILQDRIDELLDGPAIQLS